MRKFIVLSAIACACSAAVASPYYVEASVGPSRLDVMCADSASCNNTSLASKIVGGYYFDRSVAAEVSYMNYGRAKASSDYGSSNSRVRAWQFGPSFSMPFAHNWDALFRFGLAMSSASNDNTYLGQSSSSTTNKTTFYVGAGLIFYATRHLGLVGDINISPSTQGSTSTLGSKSLTMGARYSF